MEKVIVKDLLKFEFLSGLKASPNGEYLSFIKSKVNIESNDYNYELWCFDISTEKYRCLCTIPKNKDYLWLDNERILFPYEGTNKYMDPSTKYGAISIFGGEISPGFELPLLVNKISLFGEGKFIVQGEINHNDPEDLEENGAEWHILEELPFAENGAGYVSGKRQALFIFNRTTGKLESITPPMFQTKDFAVDINSTRVAIIGQESHGCEIANDGLYLYDDSVKEISCLISESRYRMFKVGFINGKTWFSGADGKRYPWSQHAWFYTVDEQDEEEIFYKNYQMPCNNTVVTDCSYGSNPLYYSGEKSIYHIITENSSSQIVETTEAKENKITKEQGSVEGLVLANEDIYFLGQRGLRLQEIYRISKSDYIEHRLTDFNEDFYQNKNISIPMPCEFENEAGDTVEGWVITPVGYNPRDDKKYPGILQIHGGPKTAYSNIYFHEMQVLANEGYFVFFCNPRGSDGRGDEFGFLIDKYGTVDYEDIMQFTNIVLESYPIDKTRLGVAGGSYGGYMTNLIIGRTNIFSAAVSQRSISNWITDEGTSDWGFLFNPYRFNGEFARQQFDYAWEISPLSLAGNVKTPILFIHSEEDFRCPPGEALQYYTALINRGIETKVCMFKNESHELSRSGTPRNRLKRLEMISLWMQEYLNQKEGAE